MLLIRNDYNRSVKFSPAVLLLLAGSAFAAPDLSTQPAWGEKEKKEFLQYLKSGQSAPALGEVKQVSMKDEGSSAAAPRKARYATLELGSESVMSVVDGTRLSHQGSGFSPRLILGTHLTTWARLYSGVQYSRIRQQKLDGTRTPIEHVQIPLGVEFALVPLGTPQTRYVVLRGGVGLHSFSGKAAQADFAGPLLGVHSSWNAGLGYEWQFSNSNWRTHFMFDGYGSLARKKGTARFYGTGLSLGLVRTF
jgi:hypothetical protein